MAKKKVYSAAFKSKVAIEALKKQSTLAELATKYEISQMTISPRPLGKPTKFFMSL